MARREQRFPLRTTIAMHEDEHDPEMAFVYVQNPSGGIFGGDRLRVEIDAGEETRLHLTGQAATKLCRSFDGGIGEQELHIRVGRRAYVEHIPEALIPHLGARYRQQTTVELGEGARFVGSELVGPGRVGESFAYEELFLRTSVLHGGHELCVDALRLEPGRQAAVSPAVLGANTWLASLLAVSDAVDGEALALRVDGVLAGLGTEVLAAAGALPRGCGVLVRILARDAVAAWRALRAAWAVVRRELLGLGLPPVRK